MLDTSFTEWVTLRVAGELYAALGGFAGIRWVGHGFKPCPHERVQSSRYMVSSFLIPVGLLEKFLNSAH